MKKGSGSVSKKKLKKLRRRRMRCILTIAWALLVIVMAVAARKAAPKLIAVFEGVVSALLLCHAALVFTKRKKPVVVSVPLALAVLLMIPGVTLGEKYVFAGGRFVHESALVTSLQVTDRWPGNIRAMQNLETLDMTNSTVTDFSPIKSLTALKSLDARGNTAFTREVYEDIASALPGCDIRYTMDVGGHAVDSTAQSIDLTDTAIAPDDARRIVSENPDKQVLYNVSLMGRSFPTDATALDLQGASPVDTAEIIDALTLLPNVTTVDLRGTPLSADAVGALCDARGDVRFLCTFDVPEGSLSSEDTEVVVPGDRYETLAAYLKFAPYMPDLISMDARGIMLDEAQTAALQDDPSSAKVLYNFTAFGRAISTSETELNLDNTKMTDTDAVERCLRALPNITKVSMCDCGLSYDQMAALCDRFPNVKFVWWVEFGKYRLRTDATAFTTNLYDNNKYHYDSAVFQPLKYCTDLMMLDIGHCELTDISFISGMTKLRVLILADNKITDLSPIAGLQDLEFVEIFLNKVSDLTPLSGKTKLKDLNIYYNPVKDLSPLKDCTALERLWCGETPLTSSMRSKLHKVLPNCKISSSGSSSTGNGWRDHKRYKTIKKMYKTGYYIPFD